MNKLQIRASGLISFVLFSIFIQSPTTHAVLGGTPAINNPVVVGLLFSKDGTKAGCSGALVSPRMVFTAAHCLTAKPENVWVAQPGSDLRDINSLRIQAEKFFTPSNFDSKKFPMDNDFGIIVLKSTFPSAATLPIATFDEIKSWTNQQSVVLHVGYGCTSLVEKPPCGATSPTPNQFTTVFEAITPQQFASLTAGTFSLTKISVSKTICGGDSGSPLLKEDSGKWIYIGAQSASNGAGCTPSCEINCVASQGLPSANLSMVAEAKLFANEVVAPVITVTTKKLTITCVKGKVSKKITALKPKCPVGFKQR
jgi:secreted trypsin-like serine protease